jgi:hypothetical protein
VKEKTDGDWCAVHAAQKGWRRDEGTIVELSETRPKCSIHSDEFRSAMNKQKSGAPFLSAVRNRYI